METPGFYSENKDNFLKSQFSPFKKTNPKNEIPQQFTNLVFDKQRPYMNYSFKQTDAREF